MSLNEYLAKTYGSKQKKNKKSSEPKNINIVDDAPIVFAKNDQVVTPPPKKKKKSGWTKLGTNETVTFVAGLQTAKDIASQNEAKEREFKRKAKLAQGKEAETVYRDEHGARVEYTDREADKLEQQREKEKWLRELNMGEVQKLGLEKASKSANAGEDPALAFVPRETAQNLSPCGRLQYSGLAAENRFGIQPGARWDGVDRGNGFEEKWFQRQNQLQESKVQKYTLQQEY